ncbi:UNVERIFIED_ORG: formylglycine-generating enzyme required for sulfatase activity [Martelella mediterranea]
MISSFRKCAQYTSLAITFSAVAANAEPWPSSVYNPAEAPAPFLLPIPCGGEIAMRQVITIPESTDENEAPLSDQSVMLGRDADDSRSFLEETRNGHIAGTLSDRETGDRFYLIGIYEVTVAQWDAVMKGPEACAERLSRADNLPKTDISWYDAIDFTRQLNRWLYSDTERFSQRLEALGADDVFVRLPTETEWEFAARGGAKVSTATRDQTLFFSEGSLEEYAWFNGSMSSGGKIRPVGGRKPNPLGLYDIYGNAEEIVLDPFQMTRIDRMHGAAGGYVVRGGSFLDPPETLTSARRDERPFFDTALGGEYRRRTMGFRIVLAGATIPDDLAAIDRFNAANQALARQLPETPADAQPLAQIAAAADEIGNKELRTKIDALKAQLEEEFARRNVLEARNIKVSVMNGALQAMDLSLGASAIDRFGDAYEAAKQSGGDADFYLPRIESEYERFFLLLDSYLETVNALSNNTAGTVKTQADTLVRELQERGDRYLIPFVRNVQSSIETSRRDHDAQKIVHFITPWPTRP